MHLYEVCLIRPDLRHEESIVQTANCFEYLNNIITEVFDRIDDRIDRNASKIRELNGRAAAVQQKVDSLVGRNKALTIFSPVKYPTLSDASNTAATFSGASRRHIPHKKPCKITSTFEDAGQRKAADKLQFYHVNRTNGTAKATESMIRLASKSLGPFPYYTESISNLLLFADMKNMYDPAKPDPASAWKRSKRDRNDGSPEAASRIDALPLPILNRNPNARKLVDHFFYTPIITDAPALDVPHLLPDLPGVADDIAFNISNIDDLLVVPNDSSFSELPVLPMPSASIVPVPPPSLPSPQPKSIEPQRMVHASVPEQRRQTHAESAAAVLPTPAPPPPPPPPPPPMPVVSATATTPSKDAIVKSEPIPKPKFEDENPHSTLMASIRQAGGLAKLRATAIQPDKQQKKAPEASSSGDLMADLHRKLAMRRKGISGTKDGQDAKPKEMATDSGGLLSSISSMIPPPPANVDSAHPSEDETDWD